MVLKKILPQKKQVEEPEEEYEEEEQEEENTEDLDKEEKVLKQRLNNLDKRTPLKPRNQMTLKVISKDQIPYERLNTVTTESGDIYEVITTEEALAEILSILREN